MTSRTHVSVRVSTRLQALHVLPLALALALLLSTDASAQSDADRGRELLEAIDWKDAPGIGKLGKVARLDIPKGCRFTDGDGAEELMEFTGNTVNGSEVGALFCETPTPGDPADPQMWFVIFQYNASGYVKDDEKTTLDADKMLATMREGQANANVERRRVGYDELTIGGWIRAPYYDEETNNLTWALSVLSDGDTSVNHSVRLLGRTGVLEVDLVSDPSGLALALPTFNEVIGETFFVPGHKYSEWIDGDKVAKYGLTALVAGGAGVAAVKLGLFGKLWKLVAGAAKLIIVGLIALGAWLKRLFSGRSDDKTRSPAPSR